VGAGADSLVRAADHTPHVRHLVDEHLIFVRAALGDEPLPHALQRGGIAAFRVQRLAHTLRQLPRLGQRVAHLERDLGLFSEIGDCNAVFRDARVDLDGERLGFRRAAGREARFVRAGSDQRSVAAESAAFHVAAATRRSAWIPEIPHESIHPDLRRQRRRQPAPATAAAASARRRSPRFAGVAADDFVRRVEDVERDRA